MNNEMKEKVADLRNKIFTLWSNEGKWESGNPDSPLYGLDRDPLITMLITAMVYQQQQIESDIERFRSGMVSELEDAILPFYLTKATPAIAMMCSAKAAGNNDNYVVGQGVDFSIQKESFQTRETLHFCPLFESNVIGAEVKAVEKQPDGKYKLTLEVKETKSSLDGVGFFFKGVDFDQLTMQLDGKAVPLICPWEYDRFPMNPDFSFWNMIYSKSLVFGTNEQWFDLWAAKNMQYYMVAPNSSLVLEQGTFELILDFKGLKTNDISVGNIAINSFPVVNITKKSFGLTPTEPIVKIADYTDFFMNLVGEKDTIEDADKFILRRYGCERFGLSELLRLADELQKRTTTDFYAYQIVPMLKDGDKMRKLKILLKDIFSILNKEGVVKSGVYAMLKDDAKVEVSVPLTALYTDGAKGNDVIAGSPVVSAPVELDLGQTRLLTTSQNGRDEVTDVEEKKMLSHYYSLTNDKVVTRTDIKMFCIKELRKYKIFADNVDVVSDEACSRIVTAYASGINPELDLESVQQTIERLIDVHSSGLMPVKVKILKSK